ncbi:TolC family protein [bacterium]|nr:TolC family protein [bacterium]
MSRRCAWFGAGLALAAALSSPGAAEEIVAVPGGGEVLTLGDCIRTALDGNADLQREREHREELRGQGWQAVSTALPTLDAVGTWSRSRDPSFLLDDSFSGGSAGTGATLSPEASAVLTELAPLFSFPSPDELGAQSFWRTSLNTEWELNPFRIVNSLSGVKVRLRQHDADLEAEGHRITEETIRVFHEVALQQENVRAVEAELAAREEFLEITRRRFELELSTELDTLQAAVSLANLRPTARRAGKSARNAAARLNVVMGREATQPLTLVPVAEVEAEPFGEVTDDALSGRPDLRSLELQVEFLEKRRGVQQADHRPSLSMSGSYGYVARRASDLGDHDTWRADVSLVLPLFDGMLTKGRVQEIDGSLAQARTQLADARRRARMELRTVLDERDAARENWDAARLTLTSAERALEQTTMRYELGQSQFLDVLNSQAQRFEARRNLIQARYDLLVSTASLKRSLGSDPALPLSRVRESTRKEQG